MKRGSRAAISVTARQTFLAAVASGEPFENAAERLLDVCGNTVRRLARKESEFARLLADATAEGKANRLGPIQHGTVNAYMHRGCRCLLCTEANTLRCRALAADRAQRAAEHAPHGTETAYMNWGCRCEPCRAAGSAKNRRSRGLATASP